MRQTVAERRISQVRFDVLAAPVEDDNCFRRWQSTTLTYSARRRRSIGNLVTPLQTWLHAARDRPACLPATLARLRLFS